MRQIFVSEKCTLSAGGVPKTDIDPEARYRPRGGEDGGFQSVPRIFEYVPNNLNHGVEPCLIRLSCLQTDPVQCLQIIANLVIPEAHSHFNSGPTWDQRVSVVADF